MLDIKQFDAGIDRAVNTEAFEEKIKKYCALAGKQFYAVMNLIVNSGHSFSVVRLTHESYSEDITLGQHYPGILEISKTEVILHK